jgi:hypothetical protein
MTQKGKAEERSQRERRLARALKENLKRRKEQRRERRSPEPEQTPGGMEKAHSCG